MKKDEILAEINKTAALEYNFQNKIEGYVSLFKAESIMPNSNDALESIRANLHSFVDLRLDNLNSQALLARQMVLKNGL